MTAPIAAVALRPQAPSVTPLRPDVVAPRVTALGGEEASQALARAYEAVVGEPPSQQTLAVLTAQWAHETGRGASMLNYNFGGAKGVGPSGLTVEARTREGHGASERRIVDRFRAYRTAEEGATDHVRLLERRFSTALAAAQAGDAQSFVRELRAGGYFTGDPAAYARSVGALADTALASGFGALTSGVAPRAGTRSAAPSEASRWSPPGAPPPLVDALPGVDAALAIADELARMSLREARERPEDSR